MFHTVGAARKLLADGGINILHEVASDGASELLAARINEMSDEELDEIFDDDDFDNGEEDADE